MSGICNERQRRAKASTRVWAGAAASLGAAEGCPCREGLRVREAGSQLPSHDRVSTGGDVQPETCKDGFPGSVLPHTEVLRGHF